MSGIFSHLYQVFRWVVRSSLWGLSPSRDDPKSLLLCFSEYRCLVAKAHSKISWKQQITFKTEWSHLVFDFGEALTCLRWDCTASLAQQHTIWEILPWVLLRSLCSMSGAAPESGLCLMSENGQSSREASKPRQVCRPPAYLVRLWKPC